MATLRTSQFYLGFSVGLSLTIIIQVYNWTMITVPHIHIRAIHSNKKDFLSKNSCLYSSRREDFNTSDKMEIYWKKRYDLLTHIHDDDDDSIAKELHKRVKILCWIMTTPANLDSRTLHVKRTWTRRCNTVLFMSSKHNASFPTIGLDVPEGRSHLTAKTMKAFKYIYDHHMEDADWFLKADDDTYVIMENLRYFLSGESPAEPVYFGARFRPYVRQGYTSGGGGYVLSKEALRRFGSEGFKDKLLCDKDRNGGAEDVEMGKCLQNLGVRLKPSLDSRNRTRFHSLSPESVFKAQFPQWFIDFDFDHGKGGIDNISDYAISFHYVLPDKMYALEFYTYHLRPYGILNRPQKLNIKT